MDILNDKEIRVFSFDNMYYAMFETPHGTMVQCGRSKTAAEENLKEYVGNRIKFYSPETAKVRSDIRKSIKHWCLDIRKPMLNGDSIDKGDWHISTWAVSGGDVKSGGDYCELCANYSDDLCRKCPLYLIGENCAKQESAYSKFRDKPDIKTVNDMIAVLIKCYKYNMG